MKPYLFLFLHIVAFLSNVIALVLGFGFYVSRGQGTAGNESSCNEVL
jgi:nitrate reductase NapE component